jgi:hypothetical protein
MLLEFFDKYTVTGCISSSGPCKLVGPNKKFEGPGMNICVEGDRREDESCGSGDEPWEYDPGGVVLGEAFGVVEDEKYDNRLLPEMLLVKPLNDDDYRKANLIFKAPFYKILL